MNESGDARAVSPLIFLLHGNGAALTFVLLWIP